MPFTPITPNNLGEVTGTYTTSPESASPADRVLEFDFAKSPYGQVVVEELSPEVSTKEWPSYVALLVGENGSEGMHGTASTFIVRDGAQALLTTSEDGARTDIRWLEGSDLEIWVTGPSLSVDDCAKIAAAF